MGGMHKFAHDKNTPTRLADLGLAHAPLPQMAVGEDSLKYDKILVWYKELMGVTEDVPTRRSIKTSSTDLERKVQKGSGSGMKRKDTLFHRRHGRRKSTNASELETGTEAMSSEARDLYIKISRGRSTTPKRTSSRSPSRSSRNGNSASPSGKRRARRSMRKSRSVASGVRR